MQFTWDAAKERSNIAKHGFNFETAQLVFEDPYVLIRQDREVDGEPRWQAIGMADGLHILLVAHAISDEEETIRIISARKASREERTIYEQGG